MHFVQLEQKLARNSNNSTATDSRTYSQAHPRSTTTNNVADVRSFLSTCLERAMAGKRLPPTYPRDSRSESIRLSAHLVRACAVSASQATVSSFSCVSGACTHDARITAVTLYGTRDHFLGSEVFTLDGPYNLIAYLSHVYTEGMHYFMYIRAHDVHFTHKSY